MLSLTRQLAQRLSICLLLAGPCCVTTPAVAESSPADTAEQQRRLHQLRARIASIQEGLEAARGERDQVNEQLRESEREIGRVARKLRVLGGRLKRLEDELGTLRDTERAQTRSLDSERAALSSQVRAAYAMGRQERIKIMLNQQDPAVISRVLAYYDYLNRERAQRMERIRVRLEALNDTRRSIDSRQARLQGLRDRAIADRDRLQEAQRLRREVIARLARRIRDQGRQLAELRDDEKELQRLLKSLQEALADIPDNAHLARPFGSLRGRLDWPARGVIANAFGTPKIGSLRWDGVMIAAKEGIEVMAVHSGRVAFADWLRGFGLMLIIDHGDGYMTLYGHNQSLFKEAGDWVETGEPVASVGSSGGREVAGVYFGIRYQGKPVNPTRWCRRPRGNKVG